MELVGVKVCGEEVGAVIALCAIAEPAGVHFGLQIYRSSTSRRLEPSAPDLLLQSPVIAEDLHRSREVHRAMQMCICREVLRKEDPAHAQIDGEAAHIALPMHLLVELVAERRADIFDARERQLPIGVESYRMGVVVVCSPIDD